MENIEYLARKRAMTKQECLQAIKLSRSKFYQWASRRGIPNMHNGKIPKQYWLLPEEKTAIIGYCQDKILEGYRRLTYQMIDDDIAYASPATVYRILKMHGLLNKWNRTEKTKKSNGFIQPLQAHEHWHVDIAYVKILTTFYFLITILDGYSRMVLHHELREHMEEYDVEITIQRAKEKYPEAEGRLISDNGSQFIAKDFKIFVRDCGLKHVRTSVRHPQSNGKLERFHKTIKHEEIRKSAYLSIEDARKQVATYIEYYNTERLHSGIYYLTPQEVFDGKTDERIAKRQEKLDNARALRKKFRKNRLSA